MPDIALFQSHQYRNDPFAKYEYMGVTPYLNALQSFMTICDALRKHGVKISKDRLDSERRAYLAISNNQCTSVKYKWENAQTDCWMTAHDTWWEDFLNQKHQWEKIELNKIGGKY